MSSMHFDTITIGDVFSFERKITKDDVLNFASISGDQNKLHVDEAYGKTSIFGKNVVHGMLAASLFSTLVGMYCPGENSLYLGQSLQFKLPIFYDDIVLVCGTVMNKNESIRVIVLKTEIFKDGKIVINGEAKVKVLE